MYGTGNRNVNTISVVTIINVVTINATILLFTFIINTLFGETRILLVLRLARLVGCVRTTSPVCDQLCSRHPRCSLGDSCPLPAKKGVVRTPP